LSDDDDDHQPVRRCDSPVRRASARTKASEEATFLTVFEAIEPGVKLRESQVADALCAERQRAYCVGVARVVKFVKR